MAAYNWPKIVAMKTNKELLEMIQNSDELDPEAVEAAKDEMERRESNVITEITPQFPPKPHDESKKQSVKRSIYSMLIFIGAFYLIFDWDLTFIFILVGVILIHEMGHYLTMRFFNYKDLGIYFIPLFGAFATGSKDNISQKQQVIILLSGPLPGVIIGIIFYYFGLRDQNYFLTRIADIFILLNLFNLLPIMPLDGGRIIKTLFFEKNELINKVFIYISIALLTVYSLSQESYFLLVVPFLLLMQLNSKSQITNVRKAIVNKGLTLDKTYSELTDEEYWLIRDEIGTFMRPFNQFITPQSYFLSGNENAIINQVKLIIQKTPNRDLKVFNKILITIAWILTFIIPFLLIGIIYIVHGS